MLRTIIIDDEKHIRESLSEMLKKHCPNVKLIDTAAGVKSGLEAINKYHPDLILLDIKMKDGTGFDLLEQIDNISFKIIFITAYDQYAIKAFKFSALDYLLKPVNSQELKEAVDKAENLSQQEINTKLNTLTGNLNTNDQAKKKIILKTFDNVYLVRVGDIIYAESDNRYTTLYLESGEKVIVSHVLKHYQEMLEEYGFYRVHKSFLINLEYIYRFEKADGGYVVMSQGTKVPVASRKREELLKLFERISE
ncbi:MAG: LytTR family DNA-binding domain-containing protein [Bacteroidetes bacterium]|nr:LytTR family DNA-binding domain-containing protein [Bacteroidota bacterium]